jgi:hypothetical protein
LGNLITIWVILVLKRSNAFTFVLFFTKINPNKGIDFYHV